MLFNWIGHPSFRRDEQLLAVLYEMGIATRRQIAIVTGWTEREIDWSIKRIRKWGQNKAERDEWIRCYRLPLDKNRIGAFTLGRQGIRYVTAMLNERKPRRRESPRAQIPHTLGINEILCRLLTNGAEKESLSWLSTLECVDFLAHLYENRGLPFDLKTTIRPDARLITGNRAYWIEYDNRTEGPRKLETKFHQYVATLHHEKAGWMDRAPIVWVTIDEQRRAYLEKLWIATRERFGEWPEMHFFVEGKETDFLCSEHSFLTR